ncbi:MAG: hypothetical protein L0I62_08190, partial [Gammaproteobacteria bacterium]|nr:hypothetical protein [Gammaproteobacteria bacterium]
PDRLVRSQVLYPTELRARVAYYRGFGGRRSIWKREFVPAVSPFEPRITAKVRQPPKRLLPA